MSTAKSEHARLTSAIADARDHGDDAAAQRLMAERSRWTPHVLAEESRAQEAREDARAAAEVAETRFAAEIEQIQIAIERARGAGLDAEIKRLYGLKAAKFAMKFPDPQPVDGRMPR